MNSQLYSNDVTLDQFFPICLPLSLTFDLCFHHIVQVEVKTTVRIYELVKLVRIRANSYVGVISADIFHLNPELVISWSNHLMIHYSLRIGPPTAGIYRFLVVSDQISWT